MNIHTKQLPRTRVAAMPQDSHLRYQQIDHPDGNQFAAIDSNQFREMPQLSTQQQSNAAANAPGSTASSSHFQAQGYPPTLPPQQYQQQQPLMQNSFYSQQQVPQFHQFQQQQDPQQAGYPQPQHLGAGNPSTATANAAAQATAQEFNYLQNSQASQPINQQQLSEMMYNSFLNHLAQKQIPNTLNPTAGTGTSVNGNNAATAFMSPPVQKYFHGSNAANSMNASLPGGMMMDPMHHTQQQLQQQQQQQQLQLQQQQGGRGSSQGNSKNSKQPAPKKLSSTQTRIEKRKQLKKQGPKRPSSAYFLFSMSIRNELLQEHPHAKVPELSKLASIRWKDLTDEQKKPFYDEFRSNWEKYRVLRDEYEKTLPPKRPSGPFIQFTQDIRPLVVKENPDKNLIEITKIIGEKWRQLDAVKKAEYTENYRIRLKEWESCYPEEPEDEILKVKVKKQKKQTS